jgi:tRNA(Ile)-lysidine synthase
MGCKLQKIVICSVLLQFLNHIERNSLCRKDDRILVAASGGIDSMVLLSLFRQAGFQIGVAHCNFQLRGAESDKDENLVRKTCELNQITFHGCRLDTSDYAWSNGLSIQVAARELRYEYFSRLVKEHGYQCIATAHHLNDSIETVLLNLTRGTGVDGLTGIPVRNGSIIRPLLPFTRKEIHDHAIQEQIEWREDESNLSDHYIRNVIRHQVIPVLQSINADFESNFCDTMERVRGMRELSHAELKNFEHNSVSQTDHKMTIEKSALRKYSSPAVVLWETLKHFGFHFHECREIVKDHQTGKIFKSKTHRLVIDRDVYIVAPDKNAEPVSVEIQEGQLQVLNGIQQLRFSNESIIQLPVNADRNVAHLDASKITFPVTWRSWHAGDFFSPLGMNAHKKISDFLIDLKVPLTDKDRVTVLESRGEIVWVVGFRISDKAKVTDGTKRILRIDWQSDVSVSA